jgi:hypothetical protein
MNTTESTTPATTSLPLIDIGIILLLLLLPFAFSNVLCRHARTTRAGHEAFNLSGQDNDKRDLFEGVGLN